MAELDDFALPSDDLLREQVYLVARGVRPLAVVAAFNAADAFLVRSKLSIVAAGEVLTFAITEGESGTCGYASHAWVVDLYRWARTQAPELQRDRVLGLLLGYGADAIRSFEELGYSLGA